MSTIDEEEEEEKKTTPAFPTSFQNGLFGFPSNNNNRGEERKRFFEFPSIGQIQEKIIDEKGQEVTVPKTERSDKSKYEYKGPGEYRIFPNRIVFDGKEYSTENAPFTPWVPGSGNPRDIRSWDFFVSGKPYPMHDIMEGKISQERTGIVAHIQMIYASQWTTAQKIAQYTALEQSISQRIETTRMPFLRPLYINAINKIKGLRIRLSQRHIFNKVDSASKRDDSKDDTNSSSKKMD